MTTENQAYDPYEAVITDLRSKRDKIDATIAALEAFRGAPGAELSGFSPPATAGAENSIVETAGMFLGMSIVDASKKLLGMRKRTMPNAEILAELKAGGLVLQGADPMNVVSSVLTRRFNNVGDVVRVGRGIWGLKEWYPGRNFKAAAKVGAAVESSLTADPVGLAASGASPDSTPPLAERLAENGNGTLHDPDSIEHANAVNLHTGWGPSAADRNF